MDQVTQQKAAMVEEANAAGATLAAEASRLKELVGRFELSYNQRQGSQQTARGRSASFGNVRNMAPAASFPRGMADKIARAFTGGGRTAMAVAPTSDNWEEF